jgi:hypothetical protein
MNSGWMDVHLASAWTLHKFYSYSLFKSFSIVGRYPVSMNILAPETGALEIRRTPQKKTKW